MRVFREQRNAVIRFIKTGKKDLEAGPHWNIPRWDEFQLGALAVSKRMTPILEAIWDEAGGKFATRVGLDPDEWSVTNPHTRAKIEQAALAFCEETNATTTETVESAVAKTREALIAGVVTEGESVEVLTKSINAIFANAEKWRARRIAQTEASRAVHAAQGKRQFSRGL